MPRLAVQSRWPGRRDWAVPSGGRSRRSRVGDQPGAQCAGNVAAVPRRRDRPLPGWSNRTAAAARRRFSVLGWRAGRATT